MWAHAPRVPRVRARSLEIQFCRDVQLRRCGGQRSCRGQQFSTTGGTTDLREGHVRRHGAWNARTRLTSKFHVPRRRKPQCPFATSAPAARSAGTLRHHESVGVKIVGQNASLRVVTQPRPREFRSDGPPPDSDSDPTTGGAAAASARGRARRRASNYRDAGKGERAACRRAGAAAAAAARRQPRDGPPGRPMGSGKGGGFKGAGGGRGGAGGGRGGGAGWRARSTRG